MNTSTKTPIEVPIPDEHGKTLHTLPNKKDEIFSLLGAEEPKKIGKKKIRFAYKIKEKLVDEKATVHLSGEKNIKL